MFRGVHISAQDFPAPVGRIEGDDLEVATTTPSGLETDAAPTVVASGSDVTVRSGHALLMLNTGGEISVCGPAHFKVIKSSGALTLALDYGRVHPSLDSADAFTIYTPTIVATPIAISGGRRDMTLGLEQNGEMCVLTARGAMRVEPQFAEQSVIVPQGGDVSLVGGQIQSLHADPSACSCDYPRASMSRPKPVSPAQTPPSASIGTLSRPLPPERKKTEDSAPPAAAAGGAVYTVLMPPLTFSANSPEPPPEPDPETILLVREVRLRPAAVYRGHVNPAPAQAAARPAPPPAPAPSEDQPLQTQPSFLNRVRNFFRKLASSNRTPCARTGCSV
ncbi:MAG TPA: hypothetical protein VGT24_04600 [Candidatus Acidoferrales bacterium]|nr:hypothetical protein [Candidatus Acidoferrales bacterium]